MSPVTFEMCNGADADLVAARTRRLRERLAAARFDTLVLTGPESVDYATGYRSVAGQLQPVSPLAAVVTVDRTLLVAPAADAAPAVERGIAPEDIVPFGRFHFAGDGPAAARSDRHPGQPEALATALGQLAASHVAVEGPGAGPVLALATEQGHQVQDATAWMLETRAVKLPGEQALLRRAAELAEEGIEAAVAIAKPGVTEQELAAAVAGAMVAGGGVPRFVVVTAGERSALADAFPSTQACRPGDLLRFDVGCQLGGYWSDIARTAVVGDPDPLQQRRYDALLAGLEDELALARPGVTAEQLFSVAIRTVEAAGLTPYRRHHVGHAIGLSVYESPIVRPGEDIALEPGMVFCLETPYYELGWGGMMVEETGVVTEDGLELFTSIDRSLRRTSA
jgi:Xaa-Pro aminopeptidase